MLDIYIAFASKHVHHEQKQLSIKNHLWTLRRENHPNKEHLPCAMDIIVRLVRDRAEQSAAAGSHWDEVSWSGRAMETNTATLYLLQLPLAEQSETSRHGVTICCIQVRNCSQKEVKAPSE